MGMMFQYRQVIEEKVKAMGADPIAIKGKIGLKAGLLVSLINANTPDDPAKIQALRVAIKEVIGVTV